MPVETKQVSPGTVVVAVSGRLVLGREVERLESVVKQLVEEAPGRVVFDLTGLDYADSAGIGTFVACLTHDPEGGRRDAPGGRERARAEAVSAYRDRQPDGPVSDGGGRHAVSDRAPSPGR